jgi:hypothetical protein
MDGVAHFVDDVVASEGNFGAQRNFLEQAAVAGNSGDAEVGTAQIDSNGKIRHRGKEYQNYCCLVICDG